jgi:hypothetical protein
MFKIFIDLKYDGFVWEAKTWRNEPESQMLLTYYGHGYTAQEAVTELFTSHPEIVPEYVKKVENSGRVYPPIRKVGEEHQDEFCTLCNTRSYGPGNFTNGLEKHKPNCPLAKTSDCDLR